ncbi:MAG: ankyrin repeat domain-containing protein, partial [Bryobacteraceae bacterium]
GADVDQKSNAGWTACMLAAATGQSDALEVLLDNGADVNARTNLGWTAEMFAASKGFDKIVQRLRQPLERGTARK